MTKPGFPMPRKKTESVSLPSLQNSSAATFLTYIASTGAGDERFELRYEDENIWMSQKTLAAVYGVEVPNISYHLRKLFSDMEISPETSVKEFLIDVGDGRQFSVKHYNLQTIVAIGFKIDNDRAVQFRKWANGIVSQYTIKGWVMDSERFIKGSPLSDKYFEEQLERIREIRMSERKFYQKVTDLYATAVDYDRSARTTREFYATVQNKMHQAVHGHTAAELIYTRADAGKEHMGLTSWGDGPDGKIRKADVSVAKNYLSEDELYVMERMVSAFLDFAETKTRGLEKASRQVPATLRPAPPPVRRRPGLPLQGPIVGRDGVREIPDCPGQDFPKRLRPLSDGIGTGRTGTREGRQPDIRRSAGWRTRCRLISQTAATISP